jgi:hypothetical protein
LAIWRLCVELCRWLAAEVKTIWGRLFETFEFGVLNLFEIWSFEFRSVQAPSLSTRLERRAYYPFPFEPSLRKWNAVRPKFETPNLKQIRSTKFQSSNGIVASRRL